MFQLRDYQQRLVDQAIASIHSGDKPLLVAPTGAGKSLILSEIARQLLAQNSGLVLILCHRREILQALERTITKHLEITPTLIEASNRTPLDQLNGPVFIAMVPTLSRRTKQIPSTWIGKIQLLVDEAHHSTAPTWSKLIELLAPQILCGCTATPVSSNRQPLSDIYSALHIGPQPGELVDQGHLCPARVYAAERAINLDGVPIKRGDYDLTKASERAITLNGDAVDLVKRFNPQLDPTLVACCDLKHAASMAEAFNDAGITAAAIDGSMATDRRDQLIQQFSSGGLKVLAFVSMIDEGMDLPEAVAIVFARPTRSVRLRRQLEGRVRRVAPEKPHCLILDLTDSWQRLPLPDDVIEWSIDAPREEGATAKPRNPDREEIVRDPTTGEVQVRQISPDRFKEILQERKPWGETPRLIEAIQQNQRGYIAFLRNNFTGRMRAIQHAVTWEGCTLEHCEQISQALGFSANWSDRTFTANVRVTSAWKRNLPQHNKGQEIFRQALHDAVEAGDLRSSALDGRLDYVGSRGNAIVIHVACDLPPDQITAAEQRLRSALEHRLAPYCLAIPGLQIVRIDRQLAFSR